MRPSPPEASCKAGLVAGRIEKSYFVDGGIFDNSGLGAAIDQIETPASRPVFDEPAGVELQVLTCGVDG